MLFDEKKNPILIKEWKYDKSGNVIKETLRGKFTSKEASDLEIDGESYWWKKGGEKIVTRAEYDDKGRKISETDPMGCATHYTYLSDNRDLVKKKLLLSPSGKIISRVFYRYDPVAPLCLEEISDDGSESSRSGMQNVTLRSIKRYSYRRDMPNWGAVSEEKTFFWTPSFGEQLFQTRQFIFDSKGRVIEERVIGSDGVSMTSKHNRYDTFDRITAVTFPDGSVERRFYDEETGRLTKLSTQKASVSFIYDHKDRIIREETDFPDGSSSTKHINYDLFGRKTTTLDERGRTSTTYTDSVGRPVKEVLPSLIVDGKAVTPVITYEYEGQAIIKKLPHGAKETILLSSLSKPFEKKAPNKSKATFQYDLMGNEISRDDGSGLVTLTEYDRQGRVVKVIEKIDGIGKRVIVEKSYKRSQLMEEKSPGLIKRFTYDRFGRVAQEEVIDRVTSLSSITSYEYDAFSRQSRVIDHAQGVVAQKRYDSMDRVIEERSSSLHDPSRILFHKEKSYNLAGDIIEERVLVHESGEMAITRFTYGKYNLLSSTTDPEGKTTFFHTSLHTQGQCGLPFYVTTTLHPDGTSTTVWKNSYDTAILTQTCDPMKRVIAERSVEVNILSKPVRVIDRPLNPETGQERGECSVTSFEYDNIGNCTALHRGSRSNVLRTTRYRYDLQSRKTHEVKPSGIELISEYDNKGRLRRYRSSDGTVDYRYPYNELDLPVVAADHVQAQ